MKIELMMMNITSHLLVLSVIVECLEECLKFKDFLCKNNFCFFILSGSSNCKLRVHRKACSLILLLVLCVPCRVQNYL